MFRVWMFSGDAYIWTELWETTAASSSVATLSVLV